MSLNQNTSSTSFYAQDVDYPSGFIIHQMPMRLSYVAALRGYIPPEPQNPFTYCELGCSIGTTLNTLAAANPESQFYGVDINAESIAKARQTASDAGLDNLIYHEKSFDNLNLNDFPDFDYITMQGTYSWLPPGTISAVLEFLARKLKPGGLFYLEHLLLPALAAAEPVAYLMRELTAHMQTSSITRAERALDELVRLCRNKADFFTRNPQAMNTVASWDRERQISPHWAINIAHAQLSGSWTPKYVNEIAREMNTAGLIRVGSTILPWNDLELAIPEEQMSMLLGIDDPILVELMCDYISPRTTRQDVFIKEAQPAPEQARDFLNRKVILTPRTVLSDLNLSVKVPGRGKVPLNGTDYQVLLEFLDTTGITVGELLSKTRARGLPDDRLFIATTRLISSNILFMCLRSCNKSNTLNNATTFSIPLQYNRYLLNQLENNLREITLASPVTGGGGVTLPAIEALLLQLWIDEGYPDIVNRALARLRHNSAVLQINKQKIHASDVTKSMITNSLNVLKLRRGPNLARIGAISIA